MTKDELERYLVNYKEICVDIQLMPEYPYLGRKIILYHNHRVCIQYKNYGSINNEEVGFQYCCPYSSFTESVKAIEDYLGKSMKEWINYTKVDFPEPPNTDLEKCARKSYLQFYSDVYAGKIKLPQKGDFYMTGPPIFKTFEELKKEWLDTAWPEK
jgi:hypothetical protein